MNDFGYFESLMENFKKVNDTQSENIRKAASLMADAIENDRLINVYGGGGHTTLPVGEMFFRAGKEFVAIPFDPEKERQKITPENISFEEKINAAEKEAKINRDDSLKNDKGRDDYML